MCLVSIQRLPAISRSYIKVYKLLLATTNGYKTPFMSANVELNQEFKALGQKEVEFEYGEQKSLVHGGFIHAFNKFPLASGIITAQLKSLLLIPNTTYIVVEAYIKPYTKYFIGKMDDIAAEKLYISDKIYNIEMYNGGIIYKERTKHSALPWNQK
jgi:hypothetical protein